MKISDLFGRVSSSPQRVRQNSVPAEQIRSTTDSDRSSISPRAKLLSKLAEEGERNSRVEQLKESIGSGKYEVPTEKVAAKIAKYLVED
jgi:flagellar biosynthesis anti-sigma factor FlgM